MQKGAGEEILLHFCPAEGYIGSVSVYVYSVMSYSVTPWTVAHKAILLMEFSRREYWSGLPFPPPGGLPDPGIKPASLEPPELAGGFFTTTQDLGVLPQRAEDPTGPQCGAFCFPGEGDTQPPGYSLGGDQLLSPDEAP